MKILTDKDYNKQPDKKMTFGKLKEMGSYELHFRSPLGYEYTVGIDSNLLITGAKYNELCHLIDFQTYQDKTFKSAYRNFLITCERVLQIISLQKAIL